MPETYGLPEPEPPRSEKAKASFEQVVAGQGIIRRTLLYVAIGAALVVLSTSLPAAIIASAGMVALILLMATDIGFR